MEESAEPEEQGEMNKVRIGRVNSVRNSKIKKTAEDPEHQLPIVYSPDYNITCYGLEKLHPFDSCKWGRVMDQLIEDGYMTESMYIRPTEASHQDLRVVHSQHYLNSLLVSCVVAKCVEVPLVALVPYCIIEKRLLKSMRLQTGGTITAAYLALEKGWAINIGGGFHHAHAYGGGGFCIYADITLALRFLFLDNKIKKAMIIDLDAHQGNGPEKDFAGDKNVCIVDVFNYEIYPRDFKAKESIDLAVRLQSYTQDTEYLYELKKALSKSLEDFEPDLVIYNAGTDCLDGDAVGHLSLSERGTVTRDEMVFTKVREAGLPIVMLLSGGYTHKSAQVISTSIKNLFDKKVIG
ncbi:unnamed protein product [Bursaphelenchus xylophilus]|uniref:Histone deacetylase 11 n=1 Tax=Bursaphelenchus xylophilus TaxID=6326 RepID=A0A1I7RSK4_BURXY|nr:unnamed protein product [Bursaphelenchus xylophilus]CAG9122890.1 unnamed protein product [Bursaphelenchus xylophilus]